MDKKKLILVVDDDEDIRVLLKEYLQGKGLDVLVAQDGKDALELAARQVPDLVITDLLLPKEHGIEVMREIKDRFFTPIIAISGIYRKEEIDAKIDDIFLDGFFEKPLDLELLFKGIQSALNE
jgi:CheY-like chemotaxis protein